MVQNERWIDSLIEGLNVLGDEAHYNEIYPIVLKVRKEKGLSIPRSSNDIIRGRMQNYSSDSKSYTGKLDIFHSTRGIGKGYWELRDEYKNIKTFSEKPIEDQTKSEFIYTKSVKFDDVSDDISMGEDGKQLESLEEAKIKKTHYKYEGRLSSSQIKKIKTLKGCRCEACNMSFAEKYPELGNGFIECHHKIPYSEMKEGEKRKLEISEFLMLCSNCHRMIHRLDDPSDIEGLKNILKKVA